MTGTKKVQISGKNGIVPPKPETRSHCSSLESSRNLFCNCGARIGT